MLWLEREETLRRKLDGVKKRYQTRLVDRSTQAHRLQLLIEGLDDLRDEALLMMGKHVDHEQHLQQLLLWKAREMEMTQEKREIEVMLSNDVETIEAMEQEMTHLSDQLGVIQVELDRYRDA
ncbi:MAG: hypothetical protein HQM07_08695 [Zetaproteobacteria bacterium]|nr:hypothetical protein [Zetaproteobacteria bacterium]